MYKGEKIARASWEYQGVNFEVSMEKEQRNTVFYGGILPRGFFAGRFLSCSTFAGGIISVTIQYNGLI